MDERRSNVFGLGGQQSSNFKQLSPYLNVDPSILQTQAPEFIMDQEMSRGRLENSFTAIGTSLFVGPTEQATAINEAIGGHELIPGTGEYIVPCRKLDELPIIEFEFGGKVFPLSGHDYVLKVNGQTILFQK